MVILGIIICKKKEFLEGYVPVFRPLVLPAQTLQSSRNVCKAITFQIGFGMIVDTVLTTY